MTRKLLISAVAEAAQECGYAFHTGFEYRINAELRELPALWLLPPKLTANDGREEGIRSYKVEFKLMITAEDNSPEKKERLWNMLEQTATGLCRLVEGNDFIRNVYGIECTPGEFSLTTRGELSMSVECSVDMPFTIRK